MIVIIMVTPQWRFQWLYSNTQNNSIFNLQNGSIVLEYYFGGNYINIVGEYYFGGKYIELKMVTIHKLWQQVLYHAIWEDARSHNMVKRRGNFCTMVEVETIFNPGESGGNFLLTEVSRPV